MRGRWMLLLLLALPIAACADKLTLAEARRDCAGDPSSACCRQADCPQGKVCDVSISCGLGSDRELWCSPAMGDRQCHATCDASHPCLAGTCQTVSIFDGSDAPDTVSICVTAR